MTEAHTLKEHEEFADTHLLNLKQYVVMVAHRGEFGDEKIGSGVLVNIGGRHLVATAAHCIKDDPRVIPGNGFCLIDKSRFIGEQPVKILRRRWHNTLDVGFLELESACGSELQAAQMCSERIVGGSVYVIGNPASAAQVFSEKATIVVQRCCIGVLPLEQTHDALKFSYDQVGVRQGIDNQWREERVPDAPGLSGGGIFGVANPSYGAILSIEYKLFGIQYAWPTSEARARGERWILAVPIQRWLDLVNS
jgi:hypothetical protein